MRVHVLAALLAPAAAFLGARSPRTASLRVHVAGGDDYDREAPSAEQEARRIALQEASMRAKARMDSMNAGGDALPELPGRARMMEANAGAPPPPRDSYAETRAAGEESRRDADMKERFERAPEGYTPYYNVGDGYLDDLTIDSTKRHWSNPENEGKTAGYDNIRTTFGARPDQDNEIDLSETYIAKPLELGDRRVVTPFALPAALPAPPPIGAPQYDAAPPAAPLPGVPLGPNDQATVSKGLAGLMNYAGAVMQGDEVPGGLKRLLAPPPDAAAAAAAPPWPLPWYEGMRRSSREVSLATAALAES